MDISSFNFPYQGFFVPNPQPFYPYVVGGEGADTTGSFNQGYVFDFQDTEDGAIRKIKVEGCDSGRRVANKQFFTKIQTSSNGSNVTSAQITEGCSGDYKFHYSAINLPDGYSVYNDGSGSFYIPLCEFDALGGITNLYLRENIHWQKTNYENVGVGEPVLYSWGDDSSIFNSANGSVKFRSIQGVGNVYVYPSDDKQTLLISYSEDSSSSGGEGGDPSSEDSGESKTAIVPFKDEHIGWVCMESPEAWFFDIVEVPISGRRTNCELCPETLWSCEKGTLSVISVQGLDKHFKGHAFVDGKNVVVECKNFFKPKTVRVFLYGIRKNHKGRHKRYTKGQYNTNKAFYNAAHNGGIQHLVIQ